MLNNCQLFDTLVMLAYFSFHLPTHRPNAAMTGRKYYRKDEEVKGRQPSFPKRENTQAAKLVQLPRSVLSKRQKVCRAMTLTHQLWTQAEKHNVEICLRSVSTQLWWQKCSQILSISNTDPRCWTHIYCSKKTAMLKMETPFRGNAAGVIC